MKSITFLNNTSLRMSFIESKLIEVHDEFFDKKKKVSKSKLARQSTVK